MTAPSSVDPKRKLKGMLARIFSDAKVEDAERSELKAYLGSGALSVADVKAVFEDFVATTWKITMADGVVSDVERQRLINIVLAHLAERLLLELADALARQVVLVADLLERELVLVVEAEAPAEDARLDRREVPEQVAAPPRPTSGRRASS
jgi:hypothetical protein